MSDQTDELSKRLAQDLEDALAFAFMGAAPRQAQRAISLRAGRFEAVDLDDGGNVIEPTPRCCHGVVLHAPDCKTGFICT